MPELPEVETVRQTLRTLVLNKKIIKVEVFYNKMIQGIKAETFQHHLEGQRLQEIDRYGKYLIFLFQDISMISHLRMEGRYYFKPSSSPKEKHEHLIFHFDDETSLRYHDTRKFGTFEISKPGEERKASGLMKCGYEPFEEDFTVSYLKSKMGKSRRMVKTLLLDQSIVCGLGNIYVDEVLFLSRIHPEKIGLNLTKLDYQNIILHSRNVLLKAIELGGSSIRTYVSSLGVTGRFQNELCVHMRKDLPCVKCNHNIIKIKVGGRGTYLCPRCQKK